MEDAERDLDLAVELVNTCYVLGDPPDKLTDTGVYQRILREAGCGDLAAQLGPDDLDDLLKLREALRPAFAAPTVQEAVEVLNPLLEDARATASLSLTDDGARWIFSRGRQGVEALRARLTAALAAHVVRHGALRLGVCQAPPCTCVYVDRSRARTRRYCCDSCNDRAAASAYRRRHAT